MTHRASNSRRRRSLSGKVSPTVELRPREERPEDSEASSGFSEWSSPLMKTRIVTGSCPSKQPHHDNDYIRRREDEFSSSQDFGDFDDEEGGSVSLSATDSPSAQSVGSQDSRKELQRNGFSFERAKMVRMLSSKSLKSSRTEATMETAPESDCSCASDSDSDDDDDDDDDESVAELLKDENHPFNIDDYFTNDDYDFDESVAAELEDLSYEEISRRFFEMHEVLRRKREKKAKKAKKKERKAKKRRSGSRRSPKQ